ncbi:MAG: DUF1365 domain-containing protein [Desulfobacca sp.]|uniref:DUF1365 domain-containing protein n=1 Tax=Desulfobacca sp. TaxID=2067990 RepID=UPI00404AA768
MNLQSCIYEGQVRHRRFQPVRHQFRYRLFLLYLDLEELPHLFADRLFWSVNHVNIAYFRRRDHLGDPRLPLDQAVRALVAAKTGTRPAGPIRLLTHLRYFGYCFNPASFYYCYDPAGERVVTIVVQVHNTPWGEEYCYVLDEARNQHLTPGFKRFQHPKEFHVSPFMPMDIWYDWRFTEPGPTLNVHFMNFAAGQRIFDATLTLSRQEITPANLTRVLLSYPPMTLKVITMIYWQALRLILKGAKFYPHPRTGKGPDAAKR